MVVIDTLIQQIKIAIGPRNKTTHPCAHICVYQMLLNKLYAFFSVLLCVCVSENQNLKENYANIRKTRLCNIYLILDPSKVLRSKSERGTFACGDPILNKARKAKHTNLDFYRKDQVLSTILIAVKQTVTNST